MPTAAQKEAAAQIMEHFAEHDSSHGYAQDARYGDGRGYCHIDTAVGTVTVGTGDRDCTSGVADAYTSAGIDCGGASWTGNYYECMMASGNFKAHRTSDGSNCDDGYIAQRGDCYLAHNDNWQHAAMCTSAEPDLLAEFSQNSFGGISGDSTGDQTGRECYEHDWYGGHWDYVMECIANGSVPSSSGKKKKETSDSTSTQPVTDAPMPRYRAKGKRGGWYDWMEGLYDTGGSGDDFAGDDGDEIMDIEFENLGDGGWFSLNVQGIGELGKNKQNTTGKPIIGVTVYYATPDPASTGYYRAMYRVHVLGGDWLKWEYDDEDGGAGNDANTIDKLQLTLTR